MECRVCIIAHYPWHVWISTNENLGVPTTFGSLPNIGVIRENLAKPMTSRYQPW
jgi:hypothetical protein